MQAYRGFESHPLRHPAFVVVPRRRGGNLASVWGGAISRKFVAIGLLALCEVAALVLWFSATAVVPSIAAEYPLSPQQVSLFTSAVQAGFVARF